MKMFAINMPMNSEKIVLHFRKCKYSQENIERHRVKLFWIGDSSFHGKFYRNDSKDVNCTHEYYAKSADGIINMVSALHSYILKYAEMSEKNSIQCNKLTLNRWFHFFFHFNPQQMSLILNSFVPTRKWN